MWSAKRDAIADDASRPETAESFRTSWPLHPEVLQTLTSKTATLETFQRVRGMLRLLARTIGRLWETRPADATAIHLHHVDPGCEPIRQEIVTRLQQSRYVPAIANDVAGSGGTPALAQDLDAKHHGGMPPYATYVARTIFMHTLAFNDPLKGLSPEQLRYSMLGPSCDVSFIEEARKKFILESAYLDDRPGAPMRFLAEANLTQIIRREEKNVDSGDARAELNDRIGQIFKGGTFDAIRFPGGPFDVPDDVGNGRPKLVVLAYDAVTIGTAEVDLAHSAIDTHSASDQPGAGQRHIARVLADLNKLRYPEDEPDSPTYVRDRTPLKKGEMTTLALRNEFRRDPGLPMLIGDDVFVRGVRQGVEQGEYVYRRGDLLLGPGDPSAEIVIDEQSVIFTMAFAKNRGIWPRPAPGASGTGGDETSGGGGQGAGSSFTQTTGSSKAREGDERPYGEETPSGALSAEGVLKDALTQIWEQARGRGIDHIGMLTIRMFEAGDAFRLLGSVGGVRGAERVVSFIGGYETSDGGSFQLEFRGPVTDAQPVREFLEPQLRAASTRNLEAGFELTFADGLSMTGDAAETFTERLSRFAGGAAYVSATAHAAES